MRDSRLQVGVALLLGVLACAVQAQDRLAAVLADAETLPPLRSVQVAVDGQTLAERSYHGGSLARATNIKSASKAVVSALVGIAIDRGVIDGVQQTIAPLLEDQLPADPDPRLFDITVEDLLTMRAGLQRTSGPNYGSWVASANWVRDALARPFVDDPGAGMLYSTGSTHLLSAILTRESGRSSLALARDWLAPLDDFSISAWSQDPQGIYFGGNQMAMTPRALLAFGELYRRGGVTADGERLVSRAWIEASWTAHTHSVYTGDGYGYGWFARRVNGHAVRYAWGYGGQVLYVVPALALTVAITSATDHPAGRSGYLGELHRLLGRIVAALPAAEGAETGG